MRCLFFFILILSLTTLIFTKYNNLTWVQCNYAEERRCKADCTSNHHYCWCAKNAMTKKVICDCLPMGYMCIRPPYEIQ